MASSPSDALHAAIDHHKAGRLVAAEALYRQVLATQPDHPDALHLTGVIRHAAGDSDTAVTLIERALRQRPQFPAALLNLGTVLAALGRTEAAAAAFIQAIAQKPSLIEARLGLAGLREQAGDLAGAVAAIATVVEDYPAQAGAWLALGRLRRKQRQHDPAIAALRQAVALSPTSYGVHNELGIALHQAGYREAAVHSYHAALACEPEAPAALRNLGHSLKRLGRIAEAVDCYRRAAHHRRSGDAPAPGDPAAASYTMASVAKLQHDIAQLEHLARQGFDAARAADLIDRYRAVCASIAARGSPTEPIKLTDAERARLGPSYNRLIHEADAPRLPGSPFGAWSPAAITADYRGASPELAVIDNFLSGEALAALRRYCRDSTVWFNFNHAGGYLAALLDDGFDCPLVLQIAEALGTALPTVFDGHALAHIWAYKYDSSLTGIGIHGDDAAVNVNFWITEDDANLDPETGGMMVWPALVPDDWQFEDFNGETARIDAFLAARNAPPIRVPYRANRAVLFNSSLFHATDAFRFRPDYAGRRINVTMLFGQRGRDAT